MIPAPKVGAAVGQFDNAGIIQEVAALQGEVLQTGTVVRQGLYNSTTQLRII